VAGSSEYGNEPSFYTKNQGLFWLPERLLASQEWLFHGVSYLQSPFVKTWLYPKGTNHCAAQMQNGVNDANYNLPIGCGDMSYTVQLKANTSCDLKQRLCYCHSNCQVKMSCWFVGKSIVICAHFNIIYI
jgi:hypothetical protein